MSEIQTGLELRAMPPLWESVSENPKDFNSQTRTHERTFQCFPGILDIYIVGLDSFGLYHHESHLGLGNTFKTAKGLEAVVMDTFSTRLSN